MNKKDNVLRKWWFTFVIIPVIIGTVILVRWVGNFDGWDELTYTILQWLIVFTVAIVIQTYFVISNKVKYKAEHYTYIGFSILITIFVGFILSAFKIFPTKWYWTLVSSLISFAVLFAFKTIMWQALHMKSNKSHNKDDRLNDLVQENESLKQELQHLKGKDLNTETTKKKWRQRN